MERFDCRTDQLPFSFLFFSIFFFLLFPHFSFFFFFRWNDTRKEIDNLMIVDKIDSTFDSNEDNNERTEMDKILTIEGKNKIIFIS